MSLLTNTKSFQRALAKWYATAMRPLPWRIEPSLYRTVVSELMAQQTQIKTMLPYFERWMVRFPDFEALAKAPSEDVLKHWEGLGYYSRARNLHKLAQIYVSMEQKPQTAAEWKTLPGIGPYTSAAISSIAQGSPAAVVDGNVVRILARLSNETQEFKNNGAAVKYFTPLADKVLDSKNPGQHNQAMMELGATICTKQNPSCPICPVAPMCLGLEASVPESIPKIQRKTPVKVEVTRIWATHESCLLLHQHPANAKQLANQYELPSIEHLAISKPETEPLLVKKRGITHHRITESIHLLDTSPTVQAAETANKSLHWIPLRKLNHVTLSGPHRRWIEELLAASKS